MPPRGSANYSKAQLWLFGTLLVSLVPFGARLAVHSICNNYPPYDIKDAVFWGLAMNIANISLLGEKNQITNSRRTTLFGVSVATLLVLAFFLGLYQLLECSSPSAKLGFWVPFITWLLAIGSTIISGLATLASVGHPLLSKLQSKLSWTIARFSDIWSR